MKPWSKITQISDLLSNLLSISPVKLNYKAHMLCTGLINFINNEGFLTASLILRLSLWARSKLGQHHLCICAAFHCRKSNDSWQVAAASPARINSPGRKFEAMKIFKFGFFSSWKNKKNHRINKKWCLAAQTRKCNLWLFKIAKGQLICHTTMIISTPSSIVKASFASNLCIFWERPHGANAYKLVGSPPLVRFKPGTSKSQADDANDLHQGLSFN